MITSGISTLNFSARLGDKFYTALENTYGRLPYLDDMTQIFFEHQIRLLKDCGRKKTIEMKDNGDIVIISKKSNIVAEKAIKDNSNNKFYLSYEILDKVLNMLCCN